jgi:hypothetical protein
MQFAAMANFEFLELAIAISNPVFSSEDCNLNNWTECEKALFDRDLTFD